MVLYAAQSATKVTSGQRMKRSRTGYILLRLTEKVSLELGFKRRKSLSMAGGKGKTVPDDRLNIIKGEKYSLTIKSQLFFKVSSVLI